MRARTKIHFSWTVSTFRSDDADGCKRLHSRARRAFIRTYLALLALFSQSPDIMATIRSSIGRTRLSCKVSSPKTIATKRQLTCAMGHHERVCQRLLVFSSASELHRLGCNVTQAVPRRAESRPQTRLCCPDLPDAAAPTGRGSCSHQSGSILLPRCR